MGFSLSRGSSDVLELAHSRAQRSEWMLRWIRLALVAIGLVGAPFLPAEYRTGFGWVMAVAALYALATRFVPLRWRQYSQLSVCLMGLDGLLILAAIHTSGGLSSPCYGLLYPAAFSAAFRVSPRATLWFCLMLAAGLVASLSWNGQLNGGEIVQVSFLMLMGLLGHSLAQVNGSRERANGLLEARLDHEDMRSRLAAIVENTHDAIIGVDLQGTVLFWNQGAERMMGISTQEVMGQSLVGVVCPTQRDRWATIFEQLKRDHPVPFQEMECHHRDGRAIQVAVAIAPMKGAQGQVVGASLVGRDVTHTRRMEEVRIRFMEERAAREAAEAAIRARDEFISIASHELRTPITTLRLQLRILRARGEGFPGEEQSRLEVIERQVSRLARLVNNLLDTTRIHREQAPLELEEVDLGALLHDAVARLSDEHGAELQVGLRLEPIVGRWDRLSLEQVVDNLLSNAVKYGDGQPIEVNASQQAGRVRIQFIDHGVGIRPEDQPRLFRQFQRGESNRHVHGLGLGLWIARHRVESMGGTIEVQSELGQGSVFTVELPREAPQLRSPSERKWISTPLDPSTSSGRA